MAEALRLAAKVLAPWLARHRESYPPIVINITDGQPNSDPTQAARALVSQGTADGSVLLYNLHLSDLASTPVTFPASLAGLPDQYAVMLFEMSSQVPPQIQQELSREGYLVEPGTRGFAFNADAGAMVQFLDIGTRLTVEGATGER
jgi:hypothetical protein